MIKRRAGKNINTLYAMIMHNRRTLVFLVIGVCMVGLLWACVSTAAGKSKHEKKAGKNAKEEKSASAGQKATITDLRFWSNPSYTRIVINADNESSFTHKLLNEDPTVNKPQRLYIEFDHAKLGENLDKTIPINDDLLSNVRAGQFTQDSVRVVVDIKSFKTYKIFSLRNPFRVILDVWGTQVAARPSEPAPAQDSTPPPPMPEISGKKGKHPAKENGLVKQLALGVRRIVIDPGHGGHDPGAVGYNKNVLEKDVALNISKRLSAKVRSKLGCEAVLTRSQDQYLTLEERTAFANTKDADLFVSVHTNASKNSASYGIETYFLNLATDDDAILVAARENATTRKSISDLQAILNDLMHNAKINESSRLAAYIQNSMYRNLSARYGKVGNKGVKQAPFYVLLGAQMPSVLVETSFISNKRECERLSDRAYLDYLSDSIVEGIRRYIVDTKPTALLMNN